MIARPPPSYEWTLHPGLTDYGAVYTLLVTKKGVALYEIRGVSIFTLSDFVYSHGFFWQRVAKKGVAVYEIRGV